MIDLQSVSHSYGVRPIFSDLSWTIPDRARVGLVGPNGAGKSTLLRILAGSEEVAAGTAVRRRGLRVAYLPQDVPAATQTPLELVLSSRPDLAALEAELAAVEVAIGETAGDLTRMERLLARQDALIVRLEAAGAAGREGEARSLLRTLGLEDDVERPLAALSGGQRKLAALAACLALRPDVLLLDEPETHLDLPHREALERLVRAFEGAVIVVSHDRYLLDETVTQIAELEGGALTLWPGTYSAYAVAKEAALARQQMLWASQQKEIARLEEAIKRFELWASVVVNERHIKQARVKQRQIDQMEKVERPVLERRKMALRLQSEIRGGQKAVELRAVTAGFGEEPIVVDASLLVRRGERVGIVGANGAGKTLLGRVLAGQIAPLAGERWIGPSIRLGYFSQTHDTLPADATPLDVVRRARPLREDEAVATLLKFLFSYDQTRRPIGTLSGGERSRLQLLVLMLGGANCLILDEPTNHLDVASAEVLEAALDEYDGTVVVISHDRYFLDRMVDRIVEVRGGTLHPFGGGYTAWRGAAGAIA